jgi:hypothetical protein
MDAGLPILHPSAGQFLYQYFPATIRDNKPGMEHDFVEIQFFKNLDHPGELEDIVLVVQKNDVP